MTNKMMNIGILQSAGVAGDIIATALNHPEHSDIFNPVIYSKENQNDKNVSNDLKFGNIDAIVVAPGSNTEFTFNGSMNVFVSKTLRLATILPDVEQDKVEDSLTANELISKIRLAWNVVRRDFMVSMPRIAVITAEKQDKNDPNNIFCTSVNALQDESIMVFGPYTVDEYIEGNYFQNFDITLALTDNDTQKVLDNTTEERVRLLAALPMVMTLTDYPKDCDFSNDNLELPALALRQAIYLAMTVKRNRTAYDEAHRNPLPKLYVERRDDSEKVRFAIPKKKSELQHDTAQ